MAVTRPREVARQIDEVRPGAIHIATEGPLGWLARGYCLARGVPFTTAYHTRFPEYVRPRFGVPLGWSYAALRRFHGPTSGIMVATASIEAALRGRGFSAPIKRWSRGVDTDVFRPRTDADLGLPRPVALFVGRVAVEKSIEDFLRLDLPGSKVVIGDGPLRAQLSRRYPDVHFLGAKHGEDLARHFAAADVFVFPSRTDTFGLVLLEALASGVPVAAYPVPGPQDVVGPTGPGALDDDLGAAVQRALKVPRDRCRAWAEGYSWGASADQFVANLAVFR